MKTGFVSFSDKKGCSSGKNTLKINRNELSGKTQIGVIIAVTDTGKWEFKEKSNGKIMFESLALT